MKVIDFINLISKDKRQNGIYTFYHEKTEWFISINAFRLVCDKEEVLSVLSDILDYKVVSIALVNDTLGIFIEEEV